MCELNMWLAYADCRTPSKGVTEGVCVETQPQDPAHLYGYPTVPVGPPAQLQVLSDSQLIHAPSKLSPLRQLSQPCLITRRNDAR